MGLLKFDEYRFHFKPQILQLDLLEQISFENKNNILKEVLNTDFVINYNAKTLKYKKTIIEDNKYHIKLANSKKTKVEKDFETSYLDNEPSCNIFVWNDKDEQKIFIESDKTSFNNSKIVAKILSQNINSLIYRYGLQIDIRVEIQTTEFWDLVKRYEGQIEGIDFTLIYPNLPAAFKTINAELKEASKLVGSDKTVVGFKAIQGDVLKNVNEDNEYLNALNKVTSIQGSPITFKVKNFRGKKKTGKSIRSIEFEEGEITVNTIEELKLAMDKLLKLE